MEKRSDFRQRTRCFLKIDNKTGVLNDISKTGLNIATPVIPKKRRVKVELDLGEKKIVFSALIMWVRRKITYGDKNIIGLAVLNSSKDFKEFYESIN